MRLVDRFERPPGACMACGNDALPAVDLDVEQPHMLAGAVGMSAYLCRMCCHEIARMFGLVEPVDTSDLEAEVADLRHWKKHLEEVVEARDSLLEKQLELVPKRKADLSRKQAVRVAERNGRDAVIRELHELAGTVPPIRDDAKQIEAFKKKARTPKGDPVEVA